MPEISKSLTCLYCDKTFNSRATASRHRAICKIKTEKQKQELEEQKKIENEKQEELREFQFKKYDLLQEQFNQQNKRIQELENTVMEQNKQIENNTKLEVIVMEQNKTVSLSSVHFLTVSSISLESCSLMLCVLGFFWYSVLIKSPLLFIHSFL